MTESGDEQHPQGGGEGHDTLSTETEVGHRDSPSPKEFFFSQVKGGEDRVEEIIAAKLRDDIDMRRPGAHLYGAGAFGVAPAVAAYD